MPDIKSIIINTPAEALEDVLSPFIEEQFPSFMRSDHRKLVLFIKAYYEWMEQSGNVGFVSRKLDSVIDIDNNLSEFYDHFQSTYLNGFPEGLAITTDVDTPNKKTLLKKIKNFYGSKGTESAYRFLFRILYDSDVQFNYPKNLILKASDGQWIEEISIKVTRNNESYHDSLAGGRVYQLTDADTIAASADIERVQKYYQNGIPVTELYLVNLVGTFSPNVLVTLDNPSVPQLSAFTEQAYGVLGDFFVETQGSNYILGDVVYISSNGVGFSAKVSQTGLAGSVKRIAIENSGINYYDTLTGIVVSSNGSNETARITLQATAITRYPGYYSGNRGKISSTQKLYDGDEYQDYSYKLKSAVSIDRYYSVLRELVHPAGMKMFGSVLLEDAVPSTMSGSTQVTRVGGTSRTVIGAYSPYTFGTTLDLRNNGVTLAGSWIINDGGVSYGKTGDLYPVGYNPYVGSTTEVGPNGKTAPSGTRFLAAGSYRDLSVPEISLTGITVEFQKMQSFTLNSGYGANLFFSAYISSGGQWWAYRIKRTRNSVVSTVLGTTLYTVNLDPSNASSVHEYRLFRVPIADMQIGDTYDLEMVASTADGTPQASATQTLYAKNFCADSGMSDYCVVAESGRTAHDPLGGALGGVTAWRGKKESILEPDMVGFSPLNVTGLTLWLKPENIGVCGGSMTTGRSMDIWLDASASQNHALPPKWDSWNSSLLYARKTTTSSNAGFWNNQQVDNVEWRVGNYGFPVSGLSGSFAAYNRIFAGFWTGGADSPSPSSVSYTNLTHAWYTYTPDNGIASSLIFHGVAQQASGSTPTQNTIFGISYSAAANTMTYYMDGVVKHTATGVPAATYYFGSSFYTPNINVSLEVVKASYQGVPVSVFSGWTCNVGVTFSAVQGVTIDKLRPTLVVADRGVPGRTGIQFNGGVVYGPHTVWTQAGLCGGYVGVTLGGVRYAPLVSGYTGEKIQSGQHFNLTRGITLTKDMTIFVAFRAGSTAAGYTQSNHGLGLVSSSKRLAAFSPSVERSRTNLLGVNANTLTDTSVWANLIYGSGVTPIRTAGVAAPDGTFTATKIVMNIGGGTLSNDICGVLATVFTTKYDKFAGFIWMRASTGTATIGLRHAGGGGYQLLPLTTTWQKFYIPETAIDTGNTTFQIILRGYIATSKSATVDVWQPQLFNGTGLTPFDSETDHLLYHRSYSDIDADATKQNSTYYPVNSLSSASFYPYESGLVGLRNNVGSTASSRIAYNPNLSTLNGISTDDITIGEWNRQKDGRIRSFYSGLESQNYSAGTSRRIARPNSPGGIAANNLAAGEVSYNTDAFSIGRFGAYCLPVLDSPRSDSTASSSFVASALLNPSYSFLGVIYEVIIYDRVLSETERQSVYSYLSRKYRAETVMPSVYVSSRPSAFGVTSGYWNISKHPNTSGSSKILAGASMGAIAIDDFGNLYGYVYKSAGTRGADGTVQTTDTYTLLGQ